MTQPPYNGAPDPDQAEAFFEALAGRGQPTPGADQMRSVVLADAQSTRAVVLAAEDATLSARDLETLAQLTREGVFKAAPASHSASADAAAASPSATAASPAGASPSATPVASTTDSWLQRWREQLSRLLAIPAALPSALAACGVVACLMVMMPTHNNGLGTPDETLRGDAPKSLSVDDPAALAQSLVTQIRALGGAARLVQINDTQWELQVSAPTPDQAKAVIALLQAQGIQGVDRLPADITLQKR